MTVVYKLYSVLCVLVVLTVVACRPAPAAPTEAPTSAPSPTPTEEAVPPQAASWDDRTVYRAGLIEAEQGVLDTLPGATVYRIDLLIPDNFYVLQGHEKLLYTNREETSLDEVYFSLFVNTSGGLATASDVEVDGQGVAGEVAFEGSAYRVPLPVALEPGDQTEIELDFEVQLPREMGGNYGLLGYFNDILALDQFYPAIPVYDDEGWNVEIPPSAGDLTYRDASFYLVEVTAPAGVKVVASGIEVSREVQGDQQVVTFAAGPARDFYLAASERFVAISQQVGQTTINSYAFPEYQQHQELALQYAADAMRSFNSRFGQYPYVEFDVVSTPMQAIGIEYPGIVGMGLHLYDSGVEISGLPSQVYLQSGVAHEVAHQWFYNVVGNDQIDEPWLDEAVVQYVTGLYYLDFGGERALEGWRESWRSRWQRVDMADIPIGLPSGDYADAGDYGAVVYGRGPLFIDALAREMGEETFNAFLKDYYRSYEWDIGTGDAFKGLAQEHCQCDLTPLFEEWVYPK
jgi:hypothetical protein